MSPNENENTNGKEKKQRNEEPIISPQFASAVDEKLKEKKTNMMQVAASVGFQYDTIRKACKGVAFAGNKVLPVICEALELDIEEMRKLIKSDKIIQMGGIPIDSDDPEAHYLIDILELFIELPRKDKKEVLDLVRLRHQEHKGKSGN